LGTPFFVHHSASQYADCPLGFYYLSTIALLSLYFASPGPEHRGLLLLAGLSAGLSAWTKNEGIVFMIVILLASAVVVIRCDGFDSYRRTMLSLVVGTAAVWPTLLYFKLKLAPANDLIGSARLHKLLEGARYLQLMAAFGDQALHFGSWVVDITPLLAFYALLVGIGVERRERPGIVISLSTLALTLAAYFAVYLVTGPDLTWHLSSSLNRLFVQLWPSVVFALFVVARSPEEAIRCSISRERG
jgi:hypothetical protein